MPEVAKRIGGANSCIPTNDEDTAGKSNTKSYTEVKYNEMNNRKEQLDTQALLKCRPRV